MERGTFFNLPNSISLSRLLLAFFFVAIDGAWQRVALVLVAGFTDVLDGWVARRSRTASVAGALIDPIADRVFVFSAVIAYLIEGLLSSGQFFLFLARDIATAIGFVVARFVPGLTSANFRARPFGKAVTVLQLGTLLAVLTAPGWVQPLVILIAILSIVSIVDYTLALERERRASGS
jgi:cardiolipin synthase